MGSHRGKRVELPHRHSCQLRHQGERKPLGERNLLRTLFATSQELSGYPHFSYYCGFIDGYYQCTCGAGKQVHHPGSWWRYLFGVCFISRQTLRDSKRLPSVAVGWALRLEPLKEQHSNMGTMDPRTKSGRFHPRWETGTGQSRGGQGGSSRRR